MTEQLTPEEIAALEEMSAKSQEVLGLDSDTDPNADALPGEQVDFNVDDEYKVTPIMPGGTYKGNIIAVAHNASKYNIVFKVCFAENNVPMSDGVTPVDGTHENYYIWLPKPGDDREMQANGKVTKRQGKINQMRDTSVDLGISMKTPQVIAEAIAYGTWIGIPVNVAVDIDTYQGRVRNKISRIVRDKSRE